VVSDLQCNRAPNFKKLGVKKESPLKACFDQLGYFYSQESATGENGEYDTVFGTEALLAHLDALQRKPAEYLEPEDLDPFGTFNWLVLKEWHAEIHVLANTVKKNHGGRGELLRRSANQEHAHMIGVARVAQSSAVGAELLKMKAQKKRSGGKAVSAEEVRVYQKSVGLSKKADGA
jgi:hypothetical protein